MVSKISSKPIDKDGYPIKKSVVCFECDKKFCLTFSFSTQNYARKNFWDYWTQQEADQEKYICDPCLRLLYTERRQKFLVVVKNLKKRNNLRSYVSGNLI